MPSVVGQARPLRWLIVAPLSAAPTGRVTAASGERFARLMSKLGPRATVQFPELPGDAAHGTVELSFERPRDFRWSEVCKRVEIFAGLTAIADEVRRKGNAKTAAAKVRALVGDGALAQAIESIDAPPEAAAPEATPAPAPAPAPAAQATKTSTDSGSALDSIFAKADVTPAQSDPTAAAKSGLDAFIGAMRTGGSKSTTKSSSRTEKSLAVEVEALLRMAINAMGLDVMGTPAVATLEAAWRGFRTVVSAAPGADDLGIDILDASADQLTSSLEQCLSVPPMDRPDAVFIATPIDDPNRLSTLATLGAARSVPIVVEVAEAIAGARIDDSPELPSAPEAWTALTQDPKAIWLCACANPMVVANEEVGTGHRVVFASPVWGVASMLSASVNQTAGPGQIFGRAGALVGPASYAPSDRGGETIATQHVATIDRQRALGARGVLVVGSERGSDRLRLAGAPMVHRGKDESTLPGRILAGRAARLTQAVRDELPPHATEQEITARLSEASTNFLPRAPAGAVALTVKTGSDGTMGIDGSIGANLAGASFSFFSDL